MRYALLPLLLVPTLLACDSSSKDGDGSKGASSSAPAIQLVVRTATVQKSLTGRSPESSQEESWTAFDGKVYVVVTADLVHNQCKKGDKLEADQGVLLISDKVKAEAVGGGDKLASVCVLCEPSVVLDCGGGQAPMRPYTFVFEVAEKADVSKAKLRYRGHEAELAKGTIRDKRGNEKLNAEIKTKRAKVTALRKKLLNTADDSGKLIQEEIKQLEKDIKKLEEQAR